jgi:hypothetical protein
MALLLSLWLLIGKHWSRLYLLAVAAVLPLLLAIGLEALLSLRGRWRTVVSAISLAVILIFLLGGIRAAIDHFGAVHGLARAERAVAEFIQAYAAQRSARPEDLTVLWGYGTPTRCSALRYGDDLSGGYLQSEITSLCNNQWFYEDFSQRVIIPGTDPQLESNTAWDILILPENYAPHIAGRFAQTLNLADFGARSLVAVTRKEGTGPDSPAPKP